MSGYATVYTRFYVRINALPANGRSVKVAKATTTGSIAIWELYFQRTSAGTLRIRLKSSVPSTLNQYYNYDYSADTWYCLEVKCYQHSTAGEYRVWLNGNEILSRTGVDTSSKQFGRLDIGNQWSDYTVTTHHDCVVISQTYIGQEGETPPIQYQLTIEVSGSGATAPVPGTYTYPEGTVVSVTALPDPGWTLSRWLRNGSNVGSANPYTVTMSDNYNLTAVLARAHFNLLRFMFLSTF